MKSRHYIFGEGECSGSSGEAWRRVLGDAHALGQDDAEAIKKRGLGVVGVSDTSQTDLAVRCGRQDDVVRLDAGKLFEDRARRVSEAGALLPHLQALPQHKGEEADEDVGPGRDLRAGARSDGR